MLTLKSLFSDYLALIAKASACSTEITKFNGIANTKLNVSKMTIDEAFNILDKESSVSELWIRWTFDKIGKELGEDVRKRLLTKIVTPMTAMHFYLDFDYLTDAEDKMLKAIFEGKLPAAEKELTANIVTRVKAIK